MIRVAICGIALATLLAGCAGLGVTEGPSPVRGKTIVLDPGHGGTADTDSYRVGPSGEREEWINLRVGLMLRDLLEARGATVIMTRTEDVPVQIAPRGLMAVESDADLFLSIHHNATADRSVNFPIVYFHGYASENQASVALGRLVAEEIRDALFDGEGPVSLVSDHTIFPNSGAGVLRNSYGVPGVLGEASFFSNADEEQRLKGERHNRREAQAYLAAIEAFFAMPTPPILEKYSTGRIPPFEVFQEADRMRPEALNWRANYESGHAMCQSETPELQSALELLTLSARSFPDSPVARRAHADRSRVLYLLGRSEESETEQARARELYVNVDEE